MQTHPSLSLTHSTAVPRPHRRLSSLSVWAASPLPTATSPPSSRGPHPLPTTSSLGRWGWITIGGGGMSKEGGGLHAERNG